MVFKSGIVYFGSALFRKSLRKNGLGEIGQKVRQIFATFVSGLKQNLSSQYSFSLDFYHFM